MSMTERKEEWLPMTEAAKEVGVSVAKLSNMAKRGRFDTAKDPRDERVTLVNMTQLRQIFNPRR